MYCKLLSNSTDRLGELLRYDYKSPTINSLELIKRHTRACIRRYYGANGHLIYRGPYTSFLQSSGYGKTKHAILLLQDDSIKGVYICLRGKGDSGYPPRTEIGADLLLQIGSTGNKVNIHNIAVRIRTMVRIYLFAILKAYKWGPPSRSFEDITGNIRYWELVQGIYMALFNSITTPAEEATIYLDEGNNDPLHIRDLNLGTFVVVIDEALALEKDLNQANNPTAEGSLLLNYVRTALAWIGHYQQIMAIFIDTNSKITNLFPPAKETITSSMRAFLSAQEEEQRKRFLQRKLLPPFYLFPMSIAQAEDYESTNLPRLHAQLVLSKSSLTLSTPSASASFSHPDAIPISYVLRPLLIALQSRGMFGIEVMRYVQHPSNSILKLFSDLLRVAIGKLRLGSDTILQDYQIPPLVLTRYFVASTIKLDRGLLVANHMATCHAISAAGDVTIDYPSEPMLVEAAIQSTMSDEGERFLKIVRWLAQHMMTDLAATTSSKGEIGELLASLLLTRVYDYTSKVVRGCFTDPLCQMQACIPVPWVMMLSHLAGEDNIDRVVNGLGDSFPRLMDAIVYPSHVVKVEATPTVNQLRSYLSRGVIVMCAFEDVGIDMIVPVAMKKAEGSSSMVDVYDSNTYDITAWFIHVKNYASAVSVTALVKRFTQNRLVKQLSEMQTVVDGSEERYSHANIPFTILNIEKYQSHIDNAAIQKVAIPKTVAGPLKEVTTQSDSGQGSVPREMLDAETTQLPADSSFPLQSSSSLWASSALKRPSETESQPRAKKQRLGKAIPPDAIYYPVTFRSNILNSMDPKPPKGFNSEILEAMSALRNMLPFAGVQDYLSEFLEYDERKISEIRQGLYPTKFNAEEQINEEVQEEQIEEE